MYFVFSGTGYINKAEWKNDYPYTASQRGRRTHRSLWEVWGWSRGCKERETSAKELNLFCYTIMKRIKYLINFFSQIFNWFLFFCCCPSESLYEWYTMQKGGICRERKIVRKEKAKWSFQGQINVNVWFSKSEKMNACYYSVT